ncbi:MBL fold metallo-hydrolase [Anaerococcus sp. mt242]|mgnify:FL=1|uniref:MBL fold metallo-hydrolase n=1 Tax=Anaerococcus sp. mt242 TaxID=2661917 RepID=UPI001933434D|nr:MBL fold metallo-hydrolase [Anaerococcus sp. mt242]MBM0047010.1 MBL fold metallo-hydrolase [Anaerococcus sp. mt242]
MKDGIIITYVYHSCYTVETKDLFIIFDYYKGLLDIPENKQVVFISTHSHSDHYTSEILKVPEMENKTYILSSDIGKLPSNENIIYIRDNKLSMDQLKSLYNSKNVQFVNKNNTYNIKLNNGQNLRIKTFGSTDKGISILLYVDDMTIFHAGDLNYWAWPKNDTETMQKEYDDFMVEVEKIKKEPVDIAFFPVDPRLDENYYKGGDIFIKEIQPQIFFPMHFADKLGISKKFKEDFSFGKTDVREITKENQKIVIDIDS